MTAKKPRLSNDEIKKQLSNTQLFLESSSKCCLEDKKNIRKSIDRLKVPRGTDLSKKEIQGIESRFNKLRIISSKLTYEMELVESHLIQILERKR